MSDREDAARWRALVGCERISCLGYVGRGAEMHIAFEFWGRFPRNKRTSEMTEKVKALLTRFADDRRKEGYR